MASRWPGWCGAVGVIEHPLGSTCEHLKDPVASTYRDPIVHGALGVRRDGNGLLYARQRYYDSSLGRWLSADPIGFAGSLNLYGYSGQNPTSWVDPEGLEPIQIPVPGTKVKLPVIPHPSDSQEAINGTHAAIVAMSQRRGSSFYGVKVLEGPNPKSNCFGEAFLRSGILPPRAAKLQCYSISGDNRLDDEINILLHAGKIREVTRANAQKGDIIGYTPNGDIDHAGVITGGNSKAGFQVTSKWGDMGVYNHKDSQVLPAYLNDGKFTQTPNGDISSTGALNARYFRVVK